MDRIKQIISASRDFISALDWLSTVTSLVLGAGVCGTLMQAITAYFHAAPLEAMAYGLAAACLAVLISISLRLFYLNTPLVSIDLDKVDENISNHVQRVCLNIAGVGVPYIRPELFAFKVNSTTIVNEDDAEEEDEDSRPLHRQPDTPSFGPPQFGVHRGETHSIPVIIYDRKADALAFRVLLPCKGITSPDSIYGSEFAMTVHAYGGPKPAEFTFYFGVDHQGTLWAKKIASGKRIISDIRERFERLKEEEIIEMNEESMGDDAR